jgi:hypothetical protein
MAGMRGTTAYIGNQDGAKTSSLERMVHVSPRSTDDQQSVGSAIGFKQSYIIRDTV